jgi:hypothetical protein
MIDRRTSLLICISTLIKEFTQIKHTNASSVQGSSRTKTGEGPAMNIDPQSVFAKINTDELVKVAL